MGKQLIVGMAASVAAAQVMANGFILRERLDSMPAMARYTAAEEGAAPKEVRGRHSGAKALQVTQGTLSWELKAGADDCFVEFWLRPVGWNAYESEAVTLCRLQVGDCEYRLYKPAAEAELVLAVGDILLQSFPIYNWTEQGWMGRDESVRWHYLHLAVSKAGVNLLVDAFPARRLSEGATSAGAIRQLTLEGGAGTSFADLHVVPGALDNKALRTRYRALYKGEPAIHEITVTVPWVDKPPTVDGTINQDEYAGMAMMTGFNTSGRGVTAFEGAGITGYIGYDAENLYFALETPYEGDLKVKPHGKHAGNGLWSDEVIEFFLCPPWTGVPDYVQLVGNAMGGTLDLRGFDGGWAGNWFWEAHPGKGAWTGELRVPFAGVEMSPPGEASVWSMNLFNSEAGISWSPTRAYHDTGSFGVLRFDRQAPVIRPGRLEYAAGKASLPLEIIGRGSSRSFTAGIEVYGEGDVLPAQSGSVVLTPKAGEVAATTLSVDLAGLHEGMLVVYVREGDTYLYYRPGRFPVLEPPRRHVAVTKQPRAATTEDGAEKPLSEADKAYARRWSTEELGTEVLNATEWSKGEVGVSDEAMAPWTPLEIEGGTMRCWGRSYSYSDSLFPAQIVSQDEALLSAAPYFELTANGKVHRLEQGSAELQKVNDSLAKVVSEGQSGPFKLRLTTEYEFDGMAKVEMNLSAPAGTGAERLELVIPFKGPRSRLFHYFDFNVAHPPETDSGAVPPQGFQLDSFHPVVWIGDMRGGLCWFAEDLRNWPLANEKGLQTFVRKDNGDGELRIKLGDKPFQPGEGLKIVFGLQATPVRPRHPRFRERSDLSAISQPWHWADGQYYPFNADAERAKADVTRLRERGKKMQPVSSLHYYGRYRYGIGSQGPIESPGLLHRELLLWEPLWKTSTSVSSPLPAIPERHTAPDGWFGEKQKPTGLCGLCAASSWQDYYLWRFKELVETTGVQSIYLDQPAVKCGNAMHGCGYTNWRGEWSSSVQIFAMRNMLKRMRRVLADAHGDDIEIRFHMSNQLLSPVLAFADTNWDGENYLFGPLKVFEFYSETLSNERLQAQHTGIPFGFAPDLLPEYQQYAPSPASVRDMMGLFWTHDSNVSPVWSSHTGLAAWLTRKRLSYNPDAMQVAYYWEPGGPVEVDTPGVNHILHYDKDRGVLILCNRTGEPRNAAVAIDHGILFGKAARPLRDAITGETIADTGDRYVVPLAPRDFRIFEIGTFGAGNP